MLSARSVRALTFLLILNGASVERGVSEGSGSGWGGGDGWRAWWWWWLLLSSAVLLCVLESRVDLKF